LLAAGENDRARRFGLRRPTPRRGRRERSNRLAALEEIWMSDENFGFAPPPFKPDEAVQRLRRELRELGLAEREGVFERRGIRIARVVSDGTAVQAAVVRRPSRSSPEWQPRSLKDSAQVRDFVAELKKKLAAWGDHDE
jgi:hypothetical protein